MRSHIVAAGVVLFLSALPASAEPKCSWGQWWVVPNGEGTLAMSVRSGAKCTVGKSSSRTGGTTSFGSMKIKARPSHGSASAGGFAFTYKSAPGYHGQDSFVFVISGMDQGRPASGTVKVNVTVR